MTSIEKSLYQYRQQKGQGQSTVNEQSWLRFMEQSGLADALKNTQLILAGVRQSSNSLPQAEQHQKVISQQDLSDSNHAMAKSSLQTLPESINRQLSNNRQVPLRPELPSESTMSNNGSIDQAGNVADIKRLEAFKDMSGFQVARHYQEWSLRNTLVLPSEHGVELWIRDASLAENKLQQVLKSIRDSMGLLGASLVKVVVNGKPIFSETKSAQQAFKEQGNGS